MKTPLKTPLSGRLLLYGRRLCATAGFLLLTLLFVTAGKALPEAGQFMTDIQLVPAILTGAWLIVLLLALLTLLFGRVYCSVICPLGIFQDVLGRLYNWRRKRRFYYRPPARLLRPAIAAVFLVALLFGNTLFVTLLEPYSLYGIMGVHTLKQGWIALNNSLAQVAVLAQPLGLYPLPYSNLATASVLLAIALALFFAVYVLLRGRDYCARICPVGTILGWLGRFALFRVRFDESRCVGCRRCEQACKTSCVDFAAQTIDYSRCVVCLNCLAGCRHEALAYRLPRFGKSGASHRLAEQEGQGTNEKRQAVAHAGRRQFLQIHAAAVTGAGVLLMTQARQGLAAPTGIESEISQRVAQTPPGSRSREHFSRRCTACQLCVARCPTLVLRPSTGEYGLLQIMQPRMDFRRGYCNYDCVICTEVCPSGALLPLTVQQKHETQTGNVQFIQHLCVVESKKQSCGACAEHCPSLAVKMVPYDKAPGLTIPEITPDLCVGCGACEHACPVVPDKAIYVQGLLSHKKARILPKGQQIHRQVDGFGF